MPVNCWIGVNAWQLLWVKETFFHVHDNLHKKYDFEKTQEILGTDIHEGLRILEENIL